MFRVATILSLFLVVSVNATDLKVADPISPNASLTGPNKASVGEQVKYTAEGSVGQDIKFSICPLSTGFECVKLMDGKDTPAVIFTPSKPGTYYIYIMLNSNNKTAFTMQVLVVSGGVTPVVPEDKTYFNIKDAIKTDKADDPQAAQYIGQLEALVAEWPNMANKAKSFTEFANVNREAGSSALGTHLPATRNVIKDYMALRLPTDPKLPYNPNLIKQVSEEVLQTLKVSK